MGWNCGIGSEKCGIEIESNHKLKRAHYKMIANAYALAWSLFETATLFPNEAI